MAALSAAAIRTTRNTAGKKYHDYTVGTSATVYAGGLVAINTSTGRAVAASDAASRKFLGLAEETATGNSGGTVTVRVAWGHEAKINAATALTTAYTGSNAAVSTDNDVTTNSDASNGVLVGEVVEIDSGNAWVYLRNYSESNV